MIVGKLVNLLASWSNRANNGTYLINLFCWLNELTEKERERGREGERIYFAQRKGVQLNSQSISACIYLYFDLVNLYITQEGRPLFKTGEGNKTMQG